MIDPRHAIGAAYGAPPGPTTCAVCGASPFGPGRPAADVFGPSFIDFEYLVAADHPDVCAGCVAMLGGKPGSVPMPLRMGHFAVVAGELLRPDGEQLLRLIEHPPKDLTAIGWTSTRQRHASLRCGPCDAGQLLIGTETVTIRWDVERDRALLDAVYRLRAAAKREDIATGQYPPHVIIALGSEWALAEAVVARYRPSPHLDLAVALVRKPEHTPEVVPMPMAVAQRRAASIVLEVAHASRFREADPIQFWGVLVQRRLVVAAGKPTLIACIGDLAQRLESSPTMILDALREVEELTEAEAAEVLTTIRETPALVVAFCRMLKKESFE